MADEVGVLPLPNELVEINSSLKNVVTVTEKTMEFLRKFTTDPSGEVSIEYELVDGTLVSKTFDNIAKLQDTLSTLDIKNTNKGLVNTADEYVLGNIENKAESEIWINGKYRLFDLGDLYGNDVGTGVLSLSFDALTDTGGTEYTGVVGVSCLVPLYGNNTMKNTNTGEVLNYNIVSRFGNSGIGDKFKIKLLSDEQWSEYGSKSLYLTTDDQYKFTNLKATFRRL